ncbi:MAG: LLM class F420-dependent oxidoreductase [Acidobacteriia bacterium]|nr:LLM class F420-dependent oxidoreductase [Terriglobia bacterium]
MWLNTRHLCLGGYHENWFFSLPNIGPVATTESVTKVAQRAEALGYSSLWTIERLLYPVKLQTPYPGTPDGSLPEAYRHVLDPLDALTFVAGQTTKIRLGTSVLDMPYHNPVVLARRLTALDVLSNGRLCVGLGLGWSKDEMDATGADITKRGARADEFLPLLKAIWTTNPVEFHGKFFDLPKSYIDLKPVQKPHPPIYIGAFVPAALKRLARLADGWNPILLPVPVMAQMFESIKQTAKEAGRDPDSISMVVHALLDLTDKPIDKERNIFCGSCDQIAEDVKGCAKIGAKEVFFDPAFSPGGQSLDRWLSLLEQLRGMMDV